MTVKSILKQNSTTFSFEFFPPKNQKGWDNLFHSIADLLPLKPSYVSVTYGAGGSTRERTNDIVIRIHKELQLNVVAHLTCVGSTRDEIAEIIDNYNEQGIHNILALRGDPPSGDPLQWASVENGFTYAADLVEFIKKRHPHFCVGVAGFVEGHPAMPNRLKELEYMKAKVDAGADYIVTQLFFNNNDFYDYRERCELANIDLPIIAGVMPIISKANLIRMAELAAGVRFPASLLKLINRADSDEYVEKAGVHWASEQVRDLLDNHVRGIHFYTMNKSNATRSIYESLGVRNSDQFQN